MVDYSCEVIGCTASGRRFEYLYPEIPVFKLSGDVFVGIDESHTATGLAVLNKDFKPMMLADIRNIRSICKEGFRVRLGFALSRILKNCNVRIGVIEKSYGGGAYSALKDLSDYIKKLECMRTAEISMIAASSWRPKYIRKEFYAGNVKREKAKMACCKETLFRYPVFSDYAKEIASDYDSFEALGMISGFLFDRFVNGLDSIEQISRTMPKSNHKFECKVVRCASDCWINEMRDRYGYVRQMLFASDLSLEENARRATAVTDDTVISLIDSEIEIIVNEWNTLKLLRADEVLVMVARRLHSRK